jgi:hypothetical protein
MIIDPLFDTTQLSASGLMKLKDIRIAFTNLLNQLRNTVPTTGREWAIVQTKLEEASFFAVKSLKNQQSNRE